MLSILTALWRLATFSVLSKLSLKFKLLNQANALLYTVGDMGEGVTLGHRALWNIAFLGNCLISIGVKLELKDGNGWHHMDVRLKAVC